VTIREIRVKKLRAFANSTAAARIPSWFEFIRHPRLHGRIQVKAFNAKTQRRKGLDCGYAALCLCVEGLIC
jgi:hypothetical protein